MLLSQNQNIRIELLDFSSEFALRPCFDNSKAVKATILLVNTSNLSIRQMENGN